MGLVQCGIFEDLYTVIKKEPAEHLLQARTQLPNAGVIVFVEEMKSLFRRADHALTEEKKLRFLMRAVRQELFAGLVRNPAETVAEFVAEATTVEKILDMRSRQYDGQASSTMAPHVDAIGVTLDMLREIIRAVIKEELRKPFPTPVQPQVASLTDVIREEVQQALGTSTSPGAPPEPQAMT